MSVLGKIVGQQASMDTRLKEVEESGGSGGSSTSGSSSSGGNIYLSHQFVDGDSYVILFPRESGAHFKGSFSTYNTYHLDVYYHTEYSEYGVITGVVVYKPYYTLPEDVSYKFVIGTYEGQEYVMMKITTTSHTSQTWLFWCEETTHPDVFNFVLSSDVSDVKESDIQGMSYTLTVSQITAEDI